MSAIDVLALLCAGSTRYHENLGRGGCVGQLSKSELAGVLSGLDTPSMRLVEAKYLGEINSEQELIEYVHDYVKDLSIKGDWNIDQGRPCLINMSVLAVLEVVRPNNCSRCNGVGFLNLVSLCKKCNGSGIMKLSGRTIASAIGISEASYRQVWNKRYSECYKYVQDIDSKVYLKVYANTVEKTGCNLRTFVA